MRALAEPSFAAWDVVRASVDTALAPELVALVRGEVAGALGAAAPPASRDEHRACRALVEQFVVDVGAITPSHRVAAFAELGDDAFPFMQVCYVCDFDARLRAAGRQLSAADIESPAAGGAELWPALEEFMRVVARHDALDPLTSEIVRLRGARAHRCRVCQSRRSLPAANDGAGESIYDQIDHFETSALSERHKTALRLVDAMLWQPFAYPETLAGELREQFSRSETVEIVLDVTRNAANKIAVAFAADAPNVTEGVEFYDIDEHGDVIYGLTPTT